MAVCDREKAPRKRKPANGERTTKWLRTNLREGERVYRKRMDVQKTERECAKKEREREREPVLKEAMGVCVR